MWLRGHQLIANPAQVVERTDAIGIKPRLASGAVTSQQIVRQSLDAIAASQLELNAFRVIFTEQALADRILAATAGLQLAFALLLSLSFTI